MAKITKRRSEGTVADERRRLLRAQRQRHELAYQLSRDQLTEAKVVGQVRQELIEIISSQLEGFGARVVLEISRTSDPAKIQQLLQREASATAKARELAAAYASTKQHC